MPPRRRASPTCAGHRPAQPRNRPSPTVERMASTQSLPSAFRAPPLSLLAMEPVRALFDFAAAKFAASPQPVGDGHPVVVFPGLGGAPFTTSHLRGFLRDSGFAAHCWGRGVNTGPEGDFDDWLDALEADLRRWHAQAGRKV